MIINFSERRRLAAELVARQEGDITKNRTANNHVVVVDLNEDNKTVHRRTTLGESGRVSIAESGVTEEINPDLIVFKDSCLRIRVSTEALLELMNFKKGSLEEYVCCELMGKMQKAGVNLVAFELGYLINSYANKNGATPAERAVNRETGIRLAEYFALAFIDDHVVAKGFISEMRDFADLDAMLENDYDSWQGKANGTYNQVPIPASLKYNDTNRSNGNVYELRADKSKTAKITDSIDKSHYDEKVTNKLGQIMEKFYLVRSNLEKNDAEDHIQWVKDLNRLYL